MRREVNWRHWLAAGAAVVLILVVGWRLLAGPAPLPTAAAPKGPHARMQDAPEAPPPIQAPR